MTGQRLRATAVGLVLATVVWLLPAATMSGGAATSACAIEGVDRIVAVGDAHGAYDQYVSILTAAGIIDAKQRWAGGRTQFVQTGDMLDRGADSRKILDLAQRLEREAPSKGGAAHILLGNHEVARMLGDFRYVSAGEYQAFATKDSEELRNRYLEIAKPADPEAMLAKLPLGSVEMQIAFSPRGDYGKWLRTLDTVAKINGILFLHGGISATVATMSCDDINTAVRTELTTTIDKTLDAPQASLAAGENGPLWYRGLAQESDEFEPAVTEILAEEHAQAIVIGHTPTSTGRIRVRFGGKVIQIDTGMLTSYITNGHASALEIQGGRFTAIYQDHREPLDVPALPAPTSKPR